MSLRRCAPFLLWTADPANPGGGGADVPAEKGGESEKAKGGLEAAAVAERKARQEAERERDELRQRLASLEKADAEKKGEFEKLYKERDSALTEVQKELERYRKAEAKRLDALKAANKTRLEALPEDWRELVPAGLDPEAQGEFLAKLEKRLSTADAGPHGGVIARPPKKVEEPIPEECKAEADKHGKDPAWWFKNVYKPRLEREAKRKK
jgi:hypothetical protein